LNRRLAIALALTMPYPPVAGGAERFVSGTGTALSRRAEVTLHYMVRPGGPHPPEIDRPGPAVHLHRYATPPGRRGDRLAMAPGLIRAASSADVVHINQFGTLTAQLLAATGQARGASVFVTDHGSSGVATGGKLGLHSLFDGFLEGSAFAGSFTPRDRTRLVYSGIDLDFYRPGERSPEPFVLYVGRLLPHKGVDWLIRSLPEGAHLVVAGRPDPGATQYLELLRSLADGRNVRFRLDVSDDEVAELYRSAWVLVLPSVEEDTFGRRHRVPELFGLTPVEAMASGTPAVVSDVASLPELVRPGETGFIVEPGDVPGLREVLSRMLRDRDMVESMGTRGREEVAQRYSWDHVAERCLNGYRELGRGRKHSGRSG
jgi:glycosyltransferase involved in cell wall biosynthesis